MFSEGTAESVRVHRLLHEELCEACAEFVAVQQTEAIMSPRLRAMTPLQRLEALLPECVGLPARRNLQDHIYRAKRREEQDGISRRGSDDRYRR